MSRHYNRPARFVSSFRGALQMICTHGNQRYSNVVSGTPQNPFFHNFTCPTSDNWIGDHLMGENMTLWVEAINDLGGIDGSNSQGISVSP